jgi:uncharacterized membrane protein (TIGR02234 family)
VIRTAQLLLVVAAASLWGASRLTWVDVTSFDGLGQPKTSTLSGGSWSTALVPLAVLLLAAAIAALAVRGWPLRLLAVLVAVASVGMGYLGIGLWVIHDLAVRACHVAGIPVADLVATQRHYAGAMITVLAAVGTLGAGVLLMRSAAKERSGATRYTRRTEAKPDEPDTLMSERMLWDALDEGRDPTNPDNKGR